MKIGLIDVDSHNFPNLALMKISAYHKAKGDVVEWWDGFKHYDIVYKARVFDDTYSTDNDTTINAGTVISGGTGYSIDSALPDIIEHQYPDYSIYLQYKEAYGFLTPGCPRGCSYCIVSKKEGSKSVQVDDLSAFWRGLKVIKLLDPNLLACLSHEILLNQLADSSAWVDFTKGHDARLLNADNVSILKRIKTKIVHI